MAGPDESVTEFRLGQLEQGFKDLRGDLKEMGGTLGGGMTALQTQLSNYQTTMADRYVSRRDFEKRGDEVDARLREMTEHNDAGATRVWFAIAAVSALGSFVAAVLSWFRPLH